MQHSPRSVCALRLFACAAAVLVAVAPTSLVAQSGTPQGGQAPAGTFQLPPVVVTAQKEPANATSLPVSVSTVTAKGLRDSGATTVSDAASGVPNVFFTEFTARKLSNPRFRGIGSSPANPAVTTYFDGVPQLNANSSSVELLDVEQVEFVRGPQSALFGRNALGGVINVLSARPSLSAWTRSVSVPLGNLGAVDVRGQASGPIIEGRLGLGVAVQFGRRDGFTVNDVTGNDLDSRSAFSAKTQLLWTPSAAWEARLLVSGERARDGDYALTDLGGLRANPRRTSRDFEGFTHRNVANTTLLLRHERDALAFTSTTGIVHWTTEDSTDLDYSPLPLVRRQNAERSTQFTQEVRVASHEWVPSFFGDDIGFRWQAGAFLFTQNYTQDAVNAFAPFVLSPFVNVPVDQHSPQAELGDSGLGVFGQATTTFAQRFDVVVGLRFDHERKDATLNTFYTPAVAAPRETAADDSYSNVSPQLAAAYRLNDRLTLYGSLAGGFKAGGFNAVSPVGREAYGVEQSWSIEGGAKTTWLSGRVAANLSLFRIDWEDLQLNLPDPRVPGQFFIDNVGGAGSSGLEVEVTARALPALDVFGSLGVTNANFKTGSVSSGIDVSGNEVPFTPGQTAAFGAQFARDVREYAVTVRGEAVVTGAFHYDDRNAASQDTYTVTNLRAGARRGRYALDLWVRNAFDVHFVPLAFPYPGLAPSGFVGENGRPRTLGVTTTVSF